MPQIGYVTTRGRIPGDVMRYERSVRVCVLNWGWSNLFGGQMRCLPTAQLTTVDGSTGYPHLIARPRND